MVKKLAFEKAISVEDNKKNIADTINLDAMGKNCYQFLYLNNIFFKLLAIENEYSGPCLEDGKVTVKFVTELMECFKSQGKLHRKYAYKILLDIKKLLMSQPSLVDIKIGDEEKFTVCGDIHGQFYDLMNIFKLNGLPLETNPYVS